MEFKPEELSLKVHLHISCTWGQLGWKVFPQVAAAHLCG